MPLILTHNKAFLPRAVNEREAADPHVEYIHGSCPGTEMKSQVLESDEVRKGLKETEAYLHIAVLPGEALGEIFVNVQYEGQKGLTEQCMKGQNDMAAAVADFVGEVLGQAEGHWEYALDSQPCSKATEHFVAPVQEHDRNVTRVNERNTSAAAPVRQELDRSA